MLVTVLIVWLGSATGGGAAAGETATGGDSATSGASRDGAITPLDERFSSGEDSGEGLLDSAFGLVGLEGQDAARSWEAASLEEGASQLLEEYAQQDACALAQSGYLDLQGQVWGCVVMGQGWADICVVKEGASGGAARVYCWRIDQDGVARDIGE